MLVSESALDMVDETGRAIEVWTISTEGGYVRASAPRLLVREGMDLVCRLVFDGRPHRVVARVVEATIASERRAALLLEVIEATIDGAQRASERLTVSLPATLVAVVCDRVVPGDRIPATLHDLSKGGAGLSLSDERPREGDLYRLELRGFAGGISEDVRVRSTRPDSGSGGQLIGCAFVAPSNETLKVVEQLLARHQPPQT
jgi:PilZ domain-containing protein